MDSIISKVLIPAAGLGTRLLSATKEQPKEMLPIFARAEDGTLCLRPLVQQIFEQVFDFGIREFYFVVGKGKRAIEDHFTPDPDYVRRLNSRAKSSQALQLESFYKRIIASTIVWVNQPETNGFGDAVFQARGCIGEGPFLVHAGDTLVRSPTGTVLARLCRAYADARTLAAAMLTLQEVDDPRQYGVAEVHETSDGCLEVERVVEKPARPTGKLAIMPLYIFNSSIFDALETTPPDKNGEVQLTDAIQRLIDAGHKIQAIKLSEDDVRVDIGTPETYWDALQLSHQHALYKS
jgi:UTP--glucose-1-phosphate uridylyltransferase